MPQIIAQLKKPETLSEFTRALALLIEDHFGDDVQTVELEHGDEPDDGGILAFDFGWDAPTGPARLLIDSAHWSKGRETVMRAITIDQAEKLLTGKLKLVYVSEPNPPMPEAVDVEGPHEAFVPSETPVIYDVPNGWDSDENLIKLAAYLRRDLHAWLSERPGIQGVDMFLDRKTHEVKFDLTFDETQDPLNGSQHFEVTVKPCWVRG